MSQDIIIDKNQQELKQYGTEAFPFCISYEDILDYYNHQCTCHWHQVVELVYVFNGTMYCQVNEQSYILNTGEGLFINSGALHFVKAIKAKSCKYYAINFSATLLSPEHSVIYKTYIEPIIYAHNLAAYQFNKQAASWCKQCLQRFLCIAQSYQHKNLGYEMQIVVYLMEFWQIFFINVKQYLSAKAVFETHSEKIKAILMYIHDNYDTKLTLKCIAQAVRISISACSHLCKCYLRQSPFTYLLRYRIEQSLPLLRQQTFSIEEIALRCGFSSSSYYARIFKRYMNMTPKQYQKTINIKNHSYLR